MQTQAQMIESEQTQVAADLITIAETARLELAAMERDHSCPLFRVPLHGSITVLVTGITAARRCRFVANAVRDLRDSMRAAGETLRSAIDRHPEFLDRERRILDVAGVLQATSRTAAAPSLEKPKAGRRNFPPRPRA